MPIHRLLKASKLGPNDVERLNRAYRNALRNLLIATILAQVSSMKRLWARLGFAIPNKAIVVLAIAILVATLCGIAITRLPILGLLEASCDNCN